MNARNRKPAQPAVRKGRIAALSMNDWCRIIAGLANLLTDAQAQPVIRKAAAAMATKWGKDEAQLVAHIQGYLDLEAA